MKAPRLHRNGDGYRSADGRFLILRGDGGLWLVIDRNAGPHPCDAFETLSGCRDLIARTMGRE